MESLCNSSLPFHYAAVQTSVENNGSDVAHRCLIILLERLHPSKPDTKFTSKGQGSKTLVAFSAELNTGPIRLPLSEKTLTPITAPAVGYSGAFFSWRDSPAFLVLHQVVPATYRVEGWDTTGTTTSLDLVRLVGAPLALVRLVGFLLRD